MSNHRATSRSQMIHVRVLLADYRRLVASGEPISSQVIAAIACCSMQTIGWWSALPARKGARYAEPSQSPGSARSLMLVHRARVYRSPACRPADNADLFSACSQASLVEPPGDRAVILACSVRSLREHWLDVRCGCGRSVVTPLRLVLQCEQCHQRPASVALQDGAAGAYGRMGATGCVWC